MIDVSPRIGEALHVDAKERALPDWQYRYWYSILPNGNDPEFQLIDAQLVKRRVRAEYFVMGHSAGRVYRVPNGDLRKLPRDDNAAWRATCRDQGTHPARTARARTGLPAQFLPADDHSGYSLCRIHGRVLWWRTFGARPRWRHVGGK